MLQAVLVGSRCLGVLWLLLAGCTRPNALYCDQASDCESSGLVCDLGTHTCVSASGTDASTTCSQNDQCHDPSAPICTDGACVKCVLDDECSSGVCRADGACESADNVLYVVPNGIAAGECPRTSPCELMYARSLVAESRNSIRVADGTYTLPGPFAVSMPIASVVLVGGRNAVFERGTPGPSFTIGTGSSLTLRGMTIHRGIECDTGTLDVARVGFNTPAAEVRPWLTLHNCKCNVTSSELLDAKDHAIDAMYGGTLMLVGTTISGATGTGVRMASGEVTILRSTISRNAGIGVDATPRQIVVSRSMIFANRMGGVRAVGGIFDVTNNYVYRNGNAASSTFGGLLLDSIYSGNRVAHNTVVRNDMDPDAMPTYAGGVFCRGGGISANNLIANNFRDNQYLPNAQTSGTCTFTGSIIQDSDDNIGFVRPIAEPFDYHLRDGNSLAVDAGILTPSPVVEDFDGQPRSDGKPEVGADEFYP